MPDGFLTKSKPIKHKNRKIEAERIAHVPRTAGFSGNLFTPPSVPVRGSRQVYQGNMTSATGCKLNITCWRARHLCLWVRGWHSAGQISY